MPVCCFISHIGLNFTTFCCRYLQMLDELILFPSIYYEKNIIWFLFDLHLLLDYTTLKFHIVYNCIVFIKILLNYMILDYWPVLNVFLVKITSSVVLTSSPLLYTEPFGKYKWFFWSINKYLIIVLREDVFRQLYMCFLFLCVAMLWYSGDKVFICASLSMR